MDGIDRRLIQDKQDQLLNVAKTAMAQQATIRDLVSVLERMYQYHYGGDVQKMDVNDKIKELEWAARLAIAAGKSHLK